MAGKTIAVTGGAGHLGSAICQGLADQGAEVLCLSSRRHAGAIGITSLVCNVADEGELTDALGCGIDGLVTCAGRSPRGLAAFADGLATLSMTELACRVALNHIPSGGSVVNIASMWGVVAPTPAIYLDLKNEPSLGIPSGAAGILALTKYLAALTAKRSVRVNAVVPGWFPRNRGTPRPDYMQEITKRVPMGRIGQPDELVGPVSFLLSDASSYMTGQQLVVDGGYSLQ